jgi:hypothetical protein
MKAKMLLTVICTCAATVVFGQQESNETASSAETTPAKTETREEVESWENHITVETVGENPSQGTVTESYPPITSTQEKSLPPTAVTSPPKNTGGAMTSGVAN